MALRVLHVVPGIPNQLWNMVFARRQIEAISAEGVDSSIVFFESRLTPWGVLRGWRRIRAAVRDYDPDIVHSHFGTVTSLICALVTRRPLVVSYRGSDLNRSPSVSLLRSHLQKLFSQIAAIRARRIICVSHDLQRRLWWSRNRVTVVPSGVDLDLFRPIPHREARAKLGWCPHEQVVLFNAGWGNRSKLKRLDLAEAAVHAAEVLCGPIRFVVLRGDLDPQQIPLLMNASNCVLLTSDHEGSPNVVKEALACNVPVVSVDVGDVRERLNGVSLSFVVEREPQALGKAIAEVIRAGSRSTGREAVLALSDEIIARRILGVYEACLSIGAAGLTESSTP